MSKTGQYIIEQEERMQKENFDDYVFMELMKSIVENGDLPPRFKRDVVSHNEPKIMLGAKEVEN